MNAAQGASHLELTGETKMFFQQIFTYSILLFLSCVICPVNAYASGGGPLLLVFNLTVFTVGFFWVIGLEYLVFRKILAANHEKILSDVIFINLISTLLIVLGGSLLISALGLSGEFVSGSLGKTILSLGTWVYEGQKSSTLSIAMAFFWFFIMYLLTVYFEGRLLSKRWKKRNNEYEITPLRASLVVNSTSYAVQLVVIIAVWHELFF